MTEQLTKREARARFGAAAALLDRLLHDLKQPLNTIGVIAQDIRIDLRKDRLAIGDLAGSMREIERSIQKLVGALDQLRTFARSGAAPEEDSAADPAAILGEAASRVRRSWPGAKVSLEVESGLPKAAIEPEALGLALFELCENAVQAAREVGREPALALTGVRRGSEVALAVRDNGGGVPDENRPRIFEPLFTTRPGAAGLGLALARALIAEAGGQLELAESTALGARFEIALAARAL